MEFNFNRWAFGQSASAVIAAGLVAIGVFEWDLRKFTYGFLVAGSFFLAGALLGLLFGIPRAVKGQNSGPYAPNTNLEEISDWLTKILVGVGLTQIPGIISQTKLLVRFLARGMGPGVESVPLVFGIAVYFLPVGFIVAYLISRIVLPEELNAAVGELAKKVETVANYAKADVAALDLVDEQLSGSAGVEQSKLNDAIAAASPVRRREIYGKAQTFRQETREADAARMERTIPVFRALIQADPDDFKPHAQLGYALKDKREPDWVGAFSELDRAIKIRGEDPTGKFPWYEFHRAICHIHFNPAMRTAIVADLRAAATRGLRDELDKKEEVKNWIAQNRVSAQELA
jgi:hypothetical protein